MMQAVKFECEEALVAEAIGLAEDRLDFVVDAFHAPIADAVFPPSEDAAGVARERFDKRLEPVGVADIGRGKGGRPRSVCRRPHTRIWALRPPETPA